MNLYRLMKLAAGRKMPRPFKLLGLAAMFRMRHRGIVCISPTREQIKTVLAKQDSTAALIEDMTYVYVAPGVCYKEDFMCGKETYAEYHKRKHTVRRLLKNIVCSSASRDKRISKKLNYTID